MEILFFCPSWGQADLPWDIFFTTVKEAGYDGVEISLPADQEESELMLNELAKHDLLLILQHWETITEDLQKHKDEYKERIENLSSIKPLFINSQTGKDYYLFYQNKELIEIAEGIERETGVPVFHETHRGKFSFAAHVTKEYLRELPQLKLTLDISHWCAVAETLLHDQYDAIEKAVYHTEHLHARVGYSQGPQVTDPRSPEWNAALQFHLDTWDKVIDIKSKSGVKNFTITCEFGPFPYMTFLPFSSQPISDQWEINLYMKNMLKERYKLSNLQM